MLKKLKNIDFNKISYDEMEKIFIEILQNKNTRAFLFLIDIQGIFGKENNILFNFDESILTPLTNKYLLSGKFDDFINSVIGGMYDGENELIKDFDYDIYVKKFGI